MAKTSHARHASDFIVPLNINGLQGRMMRVPSTTKRKREILFVYGHHASLERQWGVIDYLSQYGNVTMPDLPGFGGMQSFYRLGKKASIDNLADYLAAFIKLRYKNKKITIAALSLGFVITTRMLQRYPELTKKVDLLISVVGFTHKSEFKFSRTRYLCYRYGALFFTGRIRALFFRYVILQGWILRLVYGKTNNAKHKFEGLTPEESKRALDFEVYLWQVNDVRTYMRTTYEFLGLDNLLKRVDLPVWHIAVQADNYFDNFLIEQHLGVIYSKVESVLAVMDSHAPSVVADAKTAAPLFPQKIRNLLAKS